MSVEAGPSVDADTQPEKVRVQQLKRAQQQQKTSENRAKAQQNKDRAAQNRNRKGHSVKFADDPSSLSETAAQPTAPGGAKSTTQSKSKSTPAPGAAGRQPKKQPKKDAQKPQAGTRQGRSPAQFKSKVVVRRLPPNLPEEVFWRAVSPWVRDAADCSALTGATTPQARAEGKETEAPTSSTSLAIHTAPTVDYKQFVAGKLKADTNKQNKHSRAYVRFLSPQALVEFHKSFDRHIFRDSKGNESIAIVEFAPYQKVVLPNTSAARGGRRAKIDPKQGTIEKDADYVTFVERLNKTGDDVKRSEGDLLASLWDPKDREREKDVAAEKGKSTPLLEHLRAVKMAKLESAAALKKAKKREKAAAKAAGKAVSKGVAASAKGERAVKGEGQTSKKEKGKGIDAAENAKGPETAEKAAIKRDRRKKGKDKSKAPNTGSAGVDAIAIEANAGAKQATIQSSAATKQPPKGSSASNKPDTKAQASADASHKSAGVDADGTGKSKNKSTSKSKGKSKSKSKSTPPRKQAGANEKAATATASAATGSTPASQPAKVQILKREA